MTRRSCAECGSRGVFLWWLRAAPAWPARVLGPCVPSLPTGEEAPCLSSEQRAVFLLSPSLSPLSFSGVKRSSLFSFSPQIWLLITPQTLSRIDFSSVRRVFFVCLRQRVSWLKAAFPKVAAMGVFHPHLPRAAPLLLAGDGNCRSVLGRPESLPGSLARGMPAWVSRLLSGLRRAGTADHSF